MSKQFAESLNTAVFTTRFILENKSPILFVHHHNEDGAWEFLGMEKIISDNDYRVISIEEIINIDRTVLEIANLPLGSEAYRADLESPWIIK